jgi:hypothetical protein
MLSTKLLQLIEEHWEEIARRVMKEIRKHPDMPILAQQADLELREWCQDLVKNLGYLLTASDEAERQRRFQVLGRMRFEEDIPLHEAVGRCHILKDKIIGFIHEEGLPMTTLHLYAEEELERRVNGLFDAMVYNIVRGYEEARRMAARWA